MSGCYTYNERIMSWFMVSMVVVFLVLISGCKCDHDQGRSWSSSWPGPRGVVGGVRGLDAEALSERGFQMLNYTQTIDHFNYRPESYTTFQQRYAINFDFWGGPNTSSPIFVYTGDEGALYSDMSTGFMQDVAPLFNALLVFIEHRYYGKSLPFGSREEAYRDANTLGYFSSAQALADYAELITTLKSNLSAESCPVIAFGGSYGGMLASWFRLKYPHIVIGALASSAPILYFDDITPENGYYSVVTKDYRETSETCYNTIRDSWNEIDKIASRSNGIAVLSKKFRACTPLNESGELKSFLETMLTTRAQYDYPPEYPVNKICSAVDGAPQGSDILSRIFAAIVAVYGERSCYDLVDNSFSSDLLNGWRWQTCSEMVIPIGISGNDSMFQESPFNLTGYIDGCKRSFGISPRPHWITTEFGGRNIRSALKKFASNIIFSNGLRDPYSIGGVLQDISDSVVAIYTTQGAHCLDILSMLPDDPPWLVSQRDMEIKIIKGWIAEYNSSFASSGQR